MQTIAKQNQCVFGKLLRNASSAKRAEATRQQAGLVTYEPNYSLTSQTPQVSWTSLWMEEEQIIRIQRLPKHTYQKKSLAYVPKEKPSIRTQRVYKHMEHEGFRSIRAQRLA